MEDNKQRLNDVINELSDIIDTTHCTYCKEIMGDAEKILTQYTTIMDKAEELDKIQRERNDFLQKTSDQADEIIQEQQIQHNPPTNNGLLAGSTLRGNRPQLSRIASQIQSSPLLNNIFGDMAPFGYLFGNKKS